jgi:hypothetical protein
VTFPGRPGCNQHRTGMYSQIGVLIRCYLYAQRDTTSSV